MTNFENSPEYKKAIEEYRQKTFALVFNPTNVIITGRLADEVFLFYPQNNVKEIFDILLKEYNQQDNGCITGSGLHLGFDKPTLVDFKFMGITYKAIFLWYDNENDFIPDCFLNANK
jgi:hypothetical protein